MNGTVNVLMLANNRSIEMVGEFKCGMEGMAFATFAPCTTASVTSLRLTGVQQARRLTKAFARSFTGGLTVGHWYDISMTLPVGSYWREFYRAPTTSLPLFRSGVD